jgi:hypothetical protein
MLRRIKKLRKKECTNRERQARKRRRKKRAGRDPESHRRKKADLSHIKRNSTNDPKVKCLLQPQLPTPNKATKSMKIFHQY